MNRNICWLAANLVLCAFFYLPQVRGDTFGSGANSFDIDFVTIGNPGNLPDTTGSPNPAGSVPYIYRIGKYEISEQMIDKANALGGLGITKDTRGPDKPATSIDWFEAARFVNWLNTSTGRHAAYKFDANGGFQLWQSGDAGYDPANRFRNTLASYVLPSSDEWYKAAFYDPATSAYFDYATGSNSAPAPVASGTAPGTAVYNQSLSAGPADITQAGGLSPFGTMAQAGNVEEWHETEFDLINDNAFGNRVRRGGFWEFSALSASFRNPESPSNNLPAVGFRVVNIVPEPSGFGCLVLAALALWVITGRRPGRHWRIGHCVERYESGSTFSRQVQVAGRIINIDACAMPSNFGSRPLNNDDY